jgi:hypothetical protein
MVVTRTGRLATRVQAGRGCVGSTTSFLFLLL